MILSSRLFRKVFFYVQTVILIFYIGLLAFAAPYLEKQLYNNEETVAITFLDNVVTMIRGELSAIDSYWRSSIDARQKIQEEITELQIGIIKSKFDKIRQSSIETSKQVLTAKLSTELPTIQIPSSGKLIVINEDGDIIFHNRKELINKSKSDIKDAYGSPIFTDLSKSSGTFIQFWTIQKNQEVMKNIYYQYIPELSWYIGMEFSSSNLLIEVEKREEQIVNSVRYLLSKLSIQSNGQLLILDGKYNVIITPDESTSYSKNICKSGVVEQLQLQQQKSNNISRLHWGENADCTVKMIGWNFYFSDFNWNILLVHDVNDLYKTSDELKNRFIISIALMILTLNILAIIFIHKISVQVGSLSKVAEKVRGGDLTQQADVTSKDELGDLAISINAMISNINERTEKLNQLNTDFLAAKNEADKANISKTRFLAAVSHDLMQPLNAAKLYISSLFIDKNMNDLEQKATLKSIEAINMAEQMINELVDISKLDAGEITPILDTFDLQEIFDQLHANFSVLAEKWDLELKVVNTATIVESDKRFLKHILQNFLSNSIRYTSKGKILLGCRRHKNHLSIQVWDTGPGIAEDEQEKIFQEFVKGKANYEKDENRFGLGLAIVKKMAKILDVKIELRSWLGKGTVFSVNIPLALNTGTPQKNKLSLIEDNKELYNNQTIICIDDDLQSLDAMDTILRKLGCKTILISSIDEISDLEKDDLKKCSLIFSDYSLQNNITGIDAIKYINKISGIDIPTVIITGDKSDAVKNICQKTGYLLLNKPISIEKVILCFSTYLHT